ncbi:MAG: hypothetical protein ACK4K9_09945 [Bacteroidia bacterium]
MVKRFSYYFLSKNILFISAFITLILLTFLSFSSVKVYQKQAFNSYLSSNTKNQFIIDADENSNNNLPFTNPVLPIENVEVIDETDSNNNQNNNESFVYGFHYLNFEIIIYKSLNCACFSYISSQKSIPSIPLFVLNHSWKSHLS